MVRKRVGVGKVKEESQEVGRESEEVIRDDVSFVRIGGRVYTLTDRGAITLDEQMRKTKEYYEAKVKDVVETYRDKVKVSVASEFISSSEHLKRLGERRGVMVDVEKWDGRMMFLRNGDLAHVRPFWWRPKVFEGLVETFIDRYDLPREWFVREGLERARTEDRFRVVVKSAPAFIGAAYYLPKVGRIYMCPGYGRSFHVYRDLTFCLGGAPAATYWALSDTELSETLSVTNLDSMVDAEVTMRLQLEPWRGMFGEELDVADILNEENVEGEESCTWLAPSGWRVEDSAL